ncbi:MAG: hypothetical protein KIT02_10455 [Devosia sp.]|uniref:hypothetical protein n=1 Tax=Devosia sp. TaxID=1871048 RepID=UPI0024C945DB|nr:hypothetical protein [Devosia sp.]UYN98387.1 MAG: hypothetical protein KIT02_10455 [Devosia sp.]
MHAARSNPAPATAPIDDRPLTDDERLSRFVEDIITLNAEGAATKGRLYELGYTQGFIDANFDKARQLANRRFVRDIDDTPIKSLDAVERDIADIIGSQLPDVRRLIAECQARGISKGHLDLLFHKARARAALAFCHLPTGGAH